MKRSSIQMVHQEVMIPTSFQSHRHRKATQESQEETQEKVMDPGQRAAVLTALTISMAKDITSKIMGTRARATQVVISMIMTTATEK